MLWDDFLNSDYHDWRGTGNSEDRLDKPGWLANWMADHGLADPGAPTSEDIEALKKLRSRMLGIVQGLVSGSAVDADDLAELNRILREGPVVQQLEKSENGVRIDTVRQRYDWAGIRAEIAASFARTLVEGESSRFRICENPDCLWVYYDETRNRSKRFCDDKMCGNLIKVRRFRARKKAAEPAAPRRRQ